MIRSAWFTFALLLVIYYSGNAQDEGPITQKPRVVSKATTIYFTVGPAFRFAGNSGDYSGGLSVQAGLLKRLNRIVSVGPSVSFTKFKYDKSISDSFGDRDATGNNIFIEEGGYEIKIVHMEGGDLQFFSVGMDVRFNFIPTERVKKFSAYAIAKPFFLISKRSKVSADVETWFRGDISDTERTTWYDSGNPPEQLSLEPWDADTEFKAGMNVGVGGEWIMPSGLSIFLQSVVGFTLPVTYIDTSSFEATLADGYNNPDYPFQWKSFSSLTVSIGVAYTF